MCNTSLADMGKHWAAKAALNLLLVFSYTDVPFHSFKTLLLAFSVLFPPFHLSFMQTSCTSGQDAECEDNITDPSFPFSSSLTQAIGTSIVDTVYRAMKASSLTDQFLKFNYSWK